MVDNYPIVAIATYKDRRMSLKFNLRVKPVLLTFGRCSGDARKVPSSGWYSVNGESRQFAYRPCDMSAVNQPWSNEKCKHCSSNLQHKQDIYYYKMYTATDEFIQVEHILNRLIRVKNAGFKRSKNFKWGSKEVYFFFKSYDALKEWSEDDVEPCAIKKGYEKKVTFKKLPIPDEKFMHDLQERRKLVGAL